MKHVVTLLVVAVAFVAGYFTGQTSGHDNSSTEQTVAQLDKQSPPESVNSAALPQSAPAVKAETKPSEQQTSSPAAIVSNYSSDVASGSASASGQVVANTTPDDLRNDVSKDVQREQAAMNYPVAQEELEHWSDKHKSELKAYMDANLGQASDFMFEKILEENDLLDSPLASDTIEDDLAWRHNMEQQLNDLIWSLNTDETLSIENLVCIQKQCEITLMASKPHSVTRMYMEITSRTDQLGINKNSPAPISLMLEDENFWMYMRLKFSGNPNTANN
ncbi:hypothetical protein [Salinimonas iocasae]|uniref:Uncharacterized protein n=1 Tax=Salinimonas iocasae TaxID=2572577 RepID=A0A5B7YHF3_9ALTE|nr:hypothetical protein [Salinimonas iocasae]QCZ93899.1 hypothetical protein FBQ74_10555 [Salinimonas iocasae]